MATKRIAEGLTVIVPVQLIKTVASTATPERLSATRRPFRSATLIGNKAARTANTGTVYLGVTSGNDEQFVAIASGETVILTPSDGESLDLYDLWLDVATNGDGVCIIMS